jgi:internalin A
MTQKELLDVIEKAVRDEETSLDLSGNQLTSLPVEIGQLTALKNLDLQGESTDEPARGDWAAHGADTA